MIPPVDAPSSSGQIIHVAMLVVLQGLLLDCLLAYLDIDSKRNRSFVRLFLDPLPQAEEVMVQ
jgi:hypothetical protein